MNIFIYGARRTGKSTLLVEWANLFDLPLVFEGVYSKYQYLQELGLKQKINRDYRALGWYTRIIEDFEHYPDFKYTGQVHSIITCTPDTSEKKQTSKARDMFDYAINHKWAMIWLGAIPGPIDELTKDIGSDLALGQLQGKWYDPIEAAILKSKYIKDTL